MSVQTTLESDPEQFILYFIYIFKQYNFLKRFTPDNDHNPEGMTTLKLLCEVYGFGKAPMASSTRVGSAD